MSRLKAITATFLAVIGLSGGSSLAHADSAYTWTSSAGMVCSGGDLTRPSIGAQRAAIDPTRYPTTSPAMAVLDHVYAGTVCIQQLHGTTAAPNAAAPLGIDPGCEFPPMMVGDHQQYSETCPQGYCPSNGTSSNGCVNAYAELATTFNLLSDDFDMYNELALSFTPTVCCGTWSNVVGDYYDNNGGKWGNTVSTRTYYVTSPQDNLVYENDAQDSHSHGSFQAVGPAFILGDVFRDIGEQVHLGLAATLAANGSTGNYCWFGEFNPETDSTNQSGVCSQP